MREQYQTVERLAVLSTGRGSQKELTVASWRGEPRLDVRSWRLDPLSGELQPLRGVSLTIAEAGALRDALAQYLDQHT